MSFKKYGSMNIEGEDTKGKERTQRFGCATTRCSRGVKNMVEGNECTLDGLFRDFNLCMVKIEVETQNF